MSDTLANVEITLTGFRGGHFSKFYARRSSVDGPGFYVYGTNPAYCGRYVMPCARPDVPPRRHRHYNVKVRAGWRTLREAKAVADEMNRRDADCIGLLDSLGELHGTKF